ncbi:MAG: hypothetical protein JKY56_16510 [Kofleriaceae bacterium]|nr:hypothetical protein [Kofleriaceae bacterium]
MMMSPTIRYLLLAALTACTGADSNDATDSGQAPTADAGENASDANTDTEQALCTLAPCGGDLVGRWDFDASCLPTRPAPVDDCGTQLHTEFQLQGDVAFAEDGNADFNTRLMQYSYFWFPKRCFVSDSCDNRLNATPPVVAECVDAGEYCDCRSWTDRPYEREVLPYEVDGKDLVVRTPDGEVHFEYCAGDEGLRYVHDTGESTMATRALENKSNQ